MFTLYFDLNWYKYHLHSEWIDVINEDIVHQNWFSKAKKTFGTFHYSLNVTLVIILISCSINISSKFIFNTDNFDYVRFLDIILYLIPCLITIGLYFNTPNILDFFYIKAEMRIVTIYLMIGLIVYFSLFMLSGYINNEFITGFLYVILGSCVFWGVIMIKLIYVITKIKSEEALNIKHSTSTNDNSYKNMTEYLSKWDHFTMFVTHLAQEISIEIMTSIIEFLQFKERIYHEIESIDMLTPNNNKNELFVHEKYPLKLLKEIPHSLIVHNQEYRPKNSKERSRKSIFPSSFLSKSNKIEIENTTVNSSISHNKMNEIYKIMANKLYKKYCKIDAEFEINISHTQRNDLERILNNNNINISKLYHSFNPIIDEMYDLMAKSFVRFQARLRNTQTDLIIPKTFNNT